MLIPATSGLCPSRILDFTKRDFESNVVSTAQAFKSWDTCMDNKTCKIIAIVGICLAALLILWLVSSIIRCVCCGVQTCQALLCCCAPVNSRNYMSREIEQNQGYNPNMYAPPPPPQMQPQPVYFATPAYQPVPTNNVSYGYVSDRNGEFEETKELHNENPFADNDTAYRNNYEMDDLHNNTNNHANAHNSNHDYYGVFK